MDQNHEVIEKKLKEALGDQAVTARVFRIMESAVAETVSSLQEQEQEPEEEKTEQAPEPEPKTEEEMEASPEGLPEELAQVWNTAYDECMGAEEADATQCVNMAWSTVVKGLLPVEATEAETDEKMKKEETTEAYKQAVANLTDMLREAVSNLTPSNAASAGSSLKPQGDPHANQVMRTREAFANVPWMDQKTLEHIE